MRCFMSGYLAVQAALFVGVVIDLVLFGEPWTHSRAALLLCGVCLLLVAPAVTWLSSEVVQLARPRRLFDRRIRQPWHQIIWGAVTSVVGIVMCSLGLAFGAAYVPEMLIVTLSALAASLLVLLRPGARARRSVCPSCGYDLRGAAGTSSCNECGLHLFEAAARGKAA